MRCTMKGWRAHRLLVLAVSITLAALAVASGSAGPVFPQHPLTIISPFTAGSINDIQARVLARPLGRALKQSVVVVNAPGGSTAVGLARLETSPADGYTLLLETPDVEFLLARHEVPYQLADLVPISRLAGDGLVLYVRADSKFRTLEDFVGYARSHPGTVTVGSVGTGGVIDYFIAQLAHAAGVTVKPIPYNGGGAQVVAVLGGDVDTGFTALSNVLGNVQGGRLRILGATLPVKPEMVQGKTVRTFGSYGYTISPSALWRGLFAKAGTPADVLTTLEAAVKEATQAPESQTFAQEHTQVDLYLGGSQFGGVLRIEFAGIQRYVAQSPHS